MQKLIDYINQYAKLDDAAILELELRAETEKFKKNEFILEQGKYCNKIWFIKSGMVRKFHLHEGKEITAWIHIENEFVTSLHSYFHQTPAIEYLQACEETELIGISRQNSEKLARFPQFTIFANSLMGEHFVKIDTNSREFGLLSAKEKYDYLKQISPGMLKRAKLGHVASLMGVTQETLSRIRKQN
ncbi:cyclic nucleotide-binding domain-containing protein [Maribellus comscasis]|uniref:Cyclic nucleotide-binding domain-containing protein n=1 Tax=Maribellus comscasis TaxID=2681766 RepID=A0A6I6JMG5_9BACT|nr:Crp/Fnr family transcriptional regulator [Maribellus comscasis]QGY42248.1 cyclic nucleotide-binding domain-containing protein [Maribellus comscasis]